MTTMEEPKPPKRRNQLTLSIHADSLDELQRAVEQVSFELRDTGNNATTGGTTWGGHWEHVVTAEKTPDKYREELDAYLEAIKACCERDTDRDGNCDIHSARGVFRNAFLNPPSAEDNEAARLGLPFHIREAIRTNNMVAFKEHWDRGGELIGGLQKQVEELKRGRQS